MDEYEGVGVRIRAKVLDSPSDLGRIEDGARDALEKFREAKATAEKAGEHEVAKLADDVLKLLEPFVRGILGKEV